MLHIDPGPIRTNPASRPRHKNIMGKSALITGVTGQDGAYLSRLLVDKGYDVFGIVARRGADTSWRLNVLDIADKVTVIYGDLTDMASLCRAVETAQPD